MGRQQIRKTGRKILINGERIYLRKVRLTDTGGNYRHWMNDPEVTRYTESHSRKWSMKELRDYVKRVTGDPGYVFLAIILKEKNRYIGNVKLGPINWEHKFSDLGIIIGEKALWGKGLATEALKLAVDFAFKELNLRKLTAGAFANNVGSIKAFKKAGFSVEGVRKRKYCCNGNYVDEVLLGAFAE